MLTLTEPQCLVPLRSDLEQGRSGHRVCVVNGRIYALGGRDPYKTDIPDLERYDPETGLWTTLTAAPVPQPVASFNLAVHGDDIIVLGGQCACARSARSVRVRRVWEVSTRAQESESGRSVRVRKV